MSPAQKAWEARRSLGASLASLGIVFLLIAGLLVMFEASPREAEAVPTFENCYFFNFAHDVTGGTSSFGSAGSPICVIGTNNTVIPGAGGAFAPGAGPGMTVHVSCSDNFGFGPRTPGPGGPRTGTSDPRGKRGSRYP